MMNPWGQNQAPNAGTSALAALLSNAQKQQELADQRRRTLGYRPFQNPNASNAELRTQQQNQQSSPAQQMKQASDIYNSIYGAQTSPTGTLYGSNAGMGALPFETGAVGTSADGSAIGTLYGSGAGMGGASSAGLIGTSADGAATGTLYGSTAGGLLGTGSAAGGGTVAASGGGAVAGEGGATTALASNPYGWIALAVLANEKYNRNAGNRSSGADYWKDLITGHNIIKNDANNTWGPKLDPGNRAGVQGDYQVLGNITNGNLGGTVSALDDSSAAKPMHWIGDGLQSLGIRFW